MVDVLNVVGLLSGGKDSCYNLCHCAALGHRIVALATLAPPQGKDELDSYMYQTVGHDAVHLIADAMDLPLYRVTINGRAINQTSTYGDRLPSVPSNSRLDANDETEDLFHLLQKVKRAQPEVNAVSVGAILSNYQRVRVEHVALRAGLQMLPLSFLWQRDQAALLDEMCQAGMHSILIKVAGAGLDENDLGKSLVQMRPKLHRLNALYGAHICGEGGEYETFTLDCPLFKRKIVLERTTTMTHGESSFDGVYYLKLDAARLEDKEIGSSSLAPVFIPPLLDELSSLALRAIIQAPAWTSSNAHVRSPSKLEQVPSVARCGRWCALGGIQGIAKGDVEKEFRMSFQNLTDLLAAQDLSMAHLAHLNVYLSSQAHFATLNSVYRTLFGVDPPSRACVAVNLDSARTNILIDAMAYDDRVRPGQASPSRRALHVQGRSHWAAANIGPYSQAVDVQGRITIAGQIGLQQKTLQLVEEPEVQITLALQHARRIYKAILEDARVARRQGWVDGCICWLSDARWLPVAQTVWSCQSRDVDEEEGERLTWDDSWLGQGLSPARIPLLFVVLASDGLPRHAAAEWQLSAHDGDRIPMDGAFDEDDEEASVASPSASSGTAVIGPWAADWQVVSSRSGASTFGIAQLHKMGGQATSDDTAHLNAALSKADHMRVFYDDEEVLTEVKQELDRLRGLQGRATTLLPVRALFDRQSRVLDVALVWQGDGSGSAM